MNRRKKMILFIVALVAAFAIGVIGGQIYLYHESNVPSQVAVDDCPLHNYEGDNMLIVNTATGNISELNLKPSVLPRENGKYGVMFAGSFDGGSYMVFPDNNYVSFNPDKEKRKPYRHGQAAQHFCDDCLALIDQAAPEEIILFVDNTHTEMVIYPCGRTSNTLILNGTILDFSLFLR